MAETTPITGSYHDFSGLSRLKSQAKKDDQSALRETAQQFEAMFAQMMIKSMRDASMKSDLFESNAMDTFQSMHDQELAVQISKRDVFGITNLLTSQLSRQAPKPAAVDGQGMPIAGPALPLIPVRPAIELNKAPPSMSLRNARIEAYRINSDLDTQSPTTGHP